MDKEQKETENVTILLNSYQKKAAETAIYAMPQSLHALGYVALGLCGESGEFADRVKKILRTGEFECSTPATLALTAEDQDYLEKELGDILWYVAMACTELEIDLQDVAELNLLKLRKRKEEKTLHHIKHSD